nr:slit homolog 2 protein-like [Lytechinus pictus]
MPLEVLKDILRGVAGSTIKGLIMAGTQFDHYGGLRNLRYLELDFNKDLNAVVLDSFSGLDNLETISMVDTNIVVFSVEAPNLKGLFMTGMNSNQYDKLKSGKFYAPSMIKFNMIDSLIQCLMWDSDKNVSLFDTLVELRALNLSKNDIGIPRTIGDSQKPIFRNLFHLETLTLKQCEISVIHSLAFIGMKSLKELNLNGNEIKRLGYDSMKDFYTLQMLDITGNELEWLDNDVFTNNRNITTLILSNNKLTGLDQKTFQPIKHSLKSIDISNNPITCDCDLSWFIDWIQSQLELLQEDSNNGEASCNKKSLGLFQDKPIKEFDPSGLCDPNVMIITVSSITVVCVVVTIMLVYNYRWQLRHRFFLLKLVVVGFVEVRDARDQNDFEFDLNVIFYDDDEEWVREHLRLIIEERLPQFQRNVFGDEDLIPGMHYLEAVYFTVNRSYKTVVLLSKAAVRDRWFMLKFRTALDHVNDTQTEFVLVIFLEEIPEDELPFLARLCLSDGRPYMHWPDDARGQEYFFEELVVELTKNLRTNDLIPNE